MGDVTRNISRHEMSCQCGCGFDVCDIELMNVLQKIADHFTNHVGRRVTLDITGPNRCITHNEFVQKSVAKKKGKEYKPFSSKSQHIFGKAADFKLFDGANQIDPKHIYAFIDNMWETRLGLGLYHNRCHVDVRSFKARW